jgi:sulfate permease, SulP family
MANASLGVVKSERRASALLANLVAALVIGFLDVVVGVSLASLIFTGALERYLARGIAIALVTSAIHMLFTAIFGTFDGAISTVQDNPAVLLAVAASSVVVLVGTGPQLVPTVITVIVVSTLLTGLFLALLGYFKLGALVRYIPYPVIGGFLAGSGWLLAQGSIGAMADFPLTLATIPDLLKSSQIILWLPGVVFGLVLYWGVRRIKHYLALPGLIAGALVVFFAGLLVSGTSIEQAIGEGLLLGGTNAQATWQPLPIGTLAQADWGAVLANVGNVGLILVLSAVTLLLNISALELALGEDVDLNRELQLAGYANLLSALGGGAVGYSALSLTMLGRRMGARGRLTGILSGMICLGVVLAGTSVLAYIPKALLGGLLLFLGLDFLDGWVIKGFRKFGRLDYAVVLVILLIIATSGFLVGVGVGLVLMVILFVVNYSRINIFHHIISGAEVASRVERNAHYRHALLELRKHIYVLELQGFIFFGTANVVLEQIRSRLKSADEKPLLFLIVDLRRVTGFDSSAALSFAKVKYLAAQHNFTVILTNLTPNARQELERNGVSVDESMKVYPDMDYAVEWCEEELLLMNQVTKQHVSVTLQSQLRDSGFAKDYTMRLKDYLEKTQFAEGDYLTRKGEHASDLYFIEVGQVSVYLEMENNKRARIRSLSMGTVVGELSFYLNEQRSASVIADMVTIAYRLTREAVQEMKSKDPELAFAFDELMLRVVSERLVATNRELEALNR